jgi:membrane protease YdiL (CAAX protease family)
MPPTSPRLGRARRLAECITFVALWVGLGVAYRLDANTYLLLGVPLTALFQLLVRRAPLRALWVRRAPPFRLGPRAVAVSAALAAYPLCLFVTSLGAADSRVLLLYFVAAAAGAVCTGYSLQYARPDTGRWLLVCLASAGGSALVLMLLGALGPLVPRTPAEMLAIGSRSLLLYLPAVFVIEEVTFRGALDAHAHHPGEPEGVGSAICVSALWGLWHYPIVPAGEPLRTVAQLLIVHIPVGVGLSLCWRKSGNLLVPGVTHAAIDAVRNAVCSTIL